MEREDLTLDLDALEKWYGKFPAARSFDIGREKLGAGR